MSEQSEAEGQSPCLTRSGGRAAVERELMWTVALGGSPARIEQLMRMLSLPANDSVVAYVVRSASDGDDGVINQDSSQV